TSRLVGQRAAAFRPGFGLATPAERDRAAPSPRCRADRWLDLDAMERQLLNPEVRRGILPPEREAARPRGRAADRIMPHEHGFYVELVTDTRQRSIWHIFHHEPARVRFSDASLELRNE